MVIIRDGDGKVIKGAASFRFRGHLVVFDTIENDPLVRVVFTEGQFVDAERVASIEAAIDRITEYMMRKA
jgi:hypothetical protein